MSSPIPSIKSKYMWFLKTYTSKKSFQRFMDKWRINELKLQGLNDRQIGKRLNLHKNTVYGYIRDNNIPQSRFLGEKGFEQMIESEFFNDHHLDLERYPLAPFIARREKKSLRKAKFDHQDEFICHLRYLLDLALLKKVIATLLGVRPDTLTGWMNKFDLELQNPKSFKQMNAPSFQEFELKMNEQLAELLGIMLGDGHISHGYDMQISLNYRDYPEYVGYVYQLCTDIFGESPKVYHRTPSKSKTDLVYRKRGTGLALIEKGLKPGVKHENYIDVHSLVPKKYHKHLIKGLIDTDGSIYLASFRKFYVNFVNKSKYLIDFFARYCEEHQIQFHLYKRKNDVCQITVRKEGAKTDLLNIAEPQKLDAFLEKYPRFKYEWFD